MQSSTSIQAKELHSSYLALSDWYWHCARPIFEEHAPERVQEFERQLQTLEQLATAAKEPFTACFLGQSQIGRLKTIVNPEWLCKPQEPVWSTPCKCFLFRPGNMSVCCEMMKKTAAF